MRRTFLSILLFLACVLSWAQENPSDDTLLDAVGLFSEGDYSAARDSLNLVVAADSTQDAAYYYLGLLDYSEKNLQGALDNFSRAYRSDTSNLWYQEALASVYSALGDNGASNQLYLELLEKDPKKYRSHFTLTILADQTLAKGDDSLALAYYDQALLYDPSYIPAKLGRAEALMQAGRVADSFAATKEVLSDGRINEEAKIQYLTSLFRTFNANQWTAWKEEIIGLVRSVQQAHPQSEKPLRMELEIMYLYTDYSGIMECFRRLYLMPGLKTEDRVEILGNMGDICHQQGNEQACFDYYEQALRLNPDYAPVLNNYAYFLALKARKLHKALRMSAKTVKLEPDNPTYLDTYGWVLYLLGKAKEAKPVFKHALVYGGNQSDEVLAHYASVLESLGEKDRAEYYRAQIRNRK